ncbi:VOC family protein [Naasia aerilata]|uniref:VOC family protein n=1 Tax=Naasia aerilata TaxID=1162966 RepID=A0ABN6XQN9_9MICO|nr:VOC family protein [Naasia aerilata]BDZ47248.1 VOC family protein [Naasia aerilata]
MAPTITPFLWFDDDLEDAIAFYRDIFPNSTVGEVSRYPEGSPLPAGTVLGATFELEGQRFMGINGGPEFPFTEAFSLYVEVETQDEIDRLWTALTADGGEPSQCGWLKDRFGLSWQIVPSRLPELLTDPDPERASRAMQAMLKMTKLDLAALEAAADG